MSGDQPSDRLHRLFDEIKPFRLPPVQNWHPDKVVDFDLVVRSNGEWIHEGGIIRRRELVKLLASVLVKRGVEYQLVTPAVGYRIRIEDTPFRVLEISIDDGSDDQCIWCRTDMDEVIPLDRDHPLNPRVDSKTEEPSPVMTVRDGLEARIERSVYYELADLAVEEYPGANRYGIRSFGLFFPLM